MIVPIEPAPDRQGYWTHPALARYGELTSQQFSHWLRLHNLECEVMCMRDEDTAAFCAALEKGQPDASGWTLTPPPGRGWFLGSVHPREGGPECFWFRQFSN